MLTRALAAAPTPLKPLKPEIVRSHYNDHNLTKSYIHAFVRHEWGVVLDEAVAESEGANSLFQCESIGVGTIVLIINPEMDVRNPPRSVVILKPHDTKETTWLRSNLDLRTVFNALSNGFLASSLTALTHPFHIPYARSPYKSICIFLNSVYPKQSFNHTGTSTSIAQQSSTFDSFTEHTLSPSPDPTVSDISDMMITTKRVARMSRAAQEAQANAIAEAAGSSTTVEVPVKRGPGRPKGTTRPKGSSRKLTLIAPHKSKVTKKTKATKAASTSSTGVAPASSTIDDDSDLVLIKGRGRPRNDGLPNASSHFINRVSGTPVVVVAPPTTPVVTAPVTGPSVAVPAQQPRGRIHLRHNTGIPTPAPVVAAPKKQPPRPKPKRIIAKNITVGNSPEAIENRERLVEEFWEIRREIPYARIPKLNTKTKAPKTYPKDFVARALSVPTLVNMQRSNFMTYDLEHKVWISGLRDVDMICALILEWDGDEYIGFKRTFFDMWVEMDGLRGWDREEWREFIIRRCGKHVRDMKADRILDMYENLGWFDARHYP